MPNKFQRRFTDAHGRGLLSVLLGTFVFLLAVVNAIVDFSWLTVTGAVLVGVALLVTVARWLKDGL